LQPLSAKSCSATPVRLWSSGQVSGSATATGVLAFWGCLPAALVRYAFSASRCRIDSVNTLLSKFPSIRTNHDNKDTHDTTLSAVAEHPTNRTTIPRTQPTLSATQRRQAWRNRETKADNAQPRTEHDLSRKRRPRPRRL